MLLGALTTAIILIIKSTFKSTEYLDDVLDASAATHASNSQAREELTISTLLHVNTERECCTTVIHNKKTVTQVALNGAP